VTTGKSIARLSDSGAMVTNSVDKGKAMTLSFAFTPILDAWVSNTSSPLSAILAAYPPELQTCQTTVEKKKQ